MTMTLTTADRTTIEGAKVVVVGGASGMGLATARLAAESGARVTIISHNGARLNQAVAALPDGTAGHVADAVDAQVVGQLFSEMGEFDHLVYTAADHPKSGPITKLAIDEVRKAFAVRYFGALTVLQAAVPHLRKSGSITLTSGGAAVRPGATSGVVASITGAMEALTRALAMELAPIRVNLIRPGFTRTSLWDELPDAVRERLFTDNATKSLVGHIGEATELAQAYLYCMTQTYATGSILTVDGGFSLV